MNILVSGSNGQLGNEFKKRVKDSQHQFNFITRAELDYSNSKDIALKLNEFKFDLIINCAAYTAVDKAESEPKLAFEINANSVKALAAYCFDHQKELIHISTDFIFDGNCYWPISETQDANPVSVYGQSKWQGECFVKEYCPKSYIFRTSWLYSNHGNNFLNTMRRLMKEKDELGVVYDQIGTPTWAKGLAETCVTAAINKTAGVFHWTDEGVASWYDFALAIQELGIEKGLLDKSVPVLPIPSSQYPTPAKRPHYSVLDKQTAREAFAACKPTHWRKQLACMLDELKA